MTADTRITPEIPDCHYPNPPILITPDHPTPKHSLYLSNLDNQKILRYPAELIFVYDNSLTAGVDAVKAGLARVLTEYYPFCGRLRVSSDDNKMLEVECNGEGALFVEATLDYSVDQFLEFSGKPDKSWEKLIYKVKDCSSFLDVPPLVVQATYLKSGGMIIGLSILHCLSDGMSTAQFLKSWVILTLDPTFVLPIPPIHNREMLKPRSPPQVTCSHPLFLEPKSTPNGSNNNNLGEKYKNFNNIHDYLRSQPLVTSSITFNASQISDLKNQIAPKSLNCTSFEALAAHTWQAWVKTFNLSPLLNVKLIFPLNIRARMEPNLPKGFYGNGFVLACAEAKVEDLIANNNLSQGIKSIQYANSQINDEYVRSLIDKLEDNNLEVDLCNTLVITQWTNLGGKNLDYESGGVLHWGPLSVDTYCLLCPVIGHPDSIRVLVSLPQSIAEKFEFHMTNTFEVEAKV